MLEAIFRGRRCQVEIQSHDGTTAICRGHSVGHRHPIMFFNIPLPLKEIFYTGSEEGEPNSAYTNQD